MEEKMVKGTMVLDFVKMVKAHKNLDWNKHLKPEDWEIINSIVAAYSGHGDISLGDASRTDCLFYSKERLQQLRTRYLHPKD